VLIKSHVKFEDIPTFLTTRTSNGIKFNKNLQVGGGLTVALELCNVSNKAGVEAILTLMNILNNPGQIELSKTSNSKSWKIHLSLELP